MPFYIEFWVDGGCRPNGRFNTIAAACAVRQRKWNRQVHTRAIWNNPTNRRAELTAIIMALELALEQMRSMSFFHAPDITIHSDSRYAINCITEWVYNWPSKGWVNAKGREVANRDLIEHMLKLENRLRRNANLSYQWVPRARKPVADAGCNEKMDEMEASSDDDSSNGDDDSNY